MQSTSSLLEWIDKQQQEHIYNTSRKKEIQYKRSRFLLKQKKFNPPKLKSNGNYLYKEDEVQITKYICIYCQKEYKFHHHFQNHIVECVQRAEIVQFKSEHNNTNISQAYVYVGPNGFLEPYNEIQSSGTVDIPVVIDKFLDQNEIMEITGQLCETQRNSESSIQYQLNQDTESKEQTLINERKKKWINHSETAEVISQERGFENEMHFSNQNNSYFRTLELFEGVSTFYEEDTDTSENEKIIINSN